ncbi:Nif3-like dinuclear metal center hexameric protein [Collinsella sp. zg1085]|uniref:Nif3-like dinuclear metal center hexameric protein n=1 Tax=Collinsella sp. zg1085 TaxID=2844380 RepID=UPI001C0B0F1E|nr:Nif3-like dinuclear metal center hexameric protein [Collinsella sp. zg1085]QWT17016.1 Nif3-like dinuclear metal center hexameric protein [Collinsella sp. zg1085]
MNVSQLEQELLQHVPRVDAEVWDRVGMIVGHPDDEVCGIAIALDACLETIQAAAAQHANVLLTHHPLYIDTPTQFVPQCRHASSAGSALCMAVQLGISVISLHTNLDRSREVRERMAGLLGLEAISSLEFPLDPGRNGFGTLAQTTPISIAELTAHTAQVFQTEPRVWGNPERSITHIAYMGGSLGHLEDMLAATPAELIITGEASYHVLQDLHYRGIDAILLGHDCSEMPFVNILQDMALSIVEDIPVVTIQGSKQWWTYQGV